MSELTYKYRLLDKDCAMFYDRLKGSRAFEKESFIPDETNKKQLFDQI